MHFGCDKELERPAAWDEWKASRGWTPRVAGPTACPIRKLEADPDALSALRLYALLVDHHAWPHSPGDLGAQGARHLAALDVIRAAHRVCDDEVRDEQRRKAKGG